MNRANPAKIDLALSAPQVQAALMGRQVCPFCGTVRTNPRDLCARCAMADTPEARQGTQECLGPWFVLQSRNPAAPGMSFAMLLTLVGRQQVTPLSIVRGPTTNQMWCFAAHVRGVSRAFGLCCNCGGEVGPDWRICPHCRTPQEPPADPDRLQDDGAVLGAVPGSAPTASAPTAAPAPMRQLSVALPGAAEAVPAALIGEPTSAAGGALPEQASSWVIAGPPLAAGQADAQQAPTSFALPLAALPSTIPVGGPANRSVPPSPAMAPSLGSAMAAPSDGLLTAKDLAAAFNLRLPPAPPPRPAPPRRRRHRVLKAVGLIILLAGLGLSAVLYRDAGLRGQVLQRLGQVSKDVRQLWDALGMVFAPAPSYPALPADPSLPGITSAAQKPKPLPDPPPAPASQPVAPATLPAPAPPAPPPVLDPAVALDTARALYREAIDAQARRDYRAAVEKYEQIKKLPHDVWPTDLDVRLQEARRQVR